MATPAEVPVEISADDFNNANFTISGYVDFSELDQFYNMKNTKHTEAVVTASLKVLTDYCARMETTLTAVEHMTPTELCDFLRVFYTGVRRKCGESYAKRSMFTLRYGLRRHFQKTMRVDIANDAIFKPANYVFFTVLSQLKNTVKRDFVEGRDFQKIFSSGVTDCSTPRGLQNRVFLDLMMNVCCGGRRNLRGMRKSHFNVMTDSASNRRFVSFARDKIGNLKNLFKDGEDDSDDGNDSDEDVTIINTSSQNRMYATPEKPETCPVLTFEKYITKLNPACDFFWQRPKRYRPATEGKAWYDAIPLGKNGLGNKMKEISTEAGCSKLYSNISLKLTSKMRAKNGRMSGCKCSSQYYFTDSSDIRETTGPSWYGDIALSSDDDGTLEDEQLIMHDSIKQECYDGDIPDEQLSNISTCRNTAESHFNSEGDISVKTEVMERLFHTTNSNIVLPSSASHATTPNGTHCPAAAVSPSGANIHSVRSAHPYPIQLKRNMNQDAKCSKGNAIDLASRQGENSMASDDDHRQILPRGHLQIPGSSAQQPPCGNQNRCHETTCNPSTFPNVPVSGSSGRTSTSALSRSSLDNPTIQCVNGFDLGDRQTLSSPATPLEQDIGLRTSGGGGVAMAMHASGDNELLQLQKDVLRMQKENLALERVKIHLEIAKLEAETMRLQSEKRN